MFCSFAYEAYGYSPVVRIPRGATNIRMTDNSTNYIGKQSNSYIDNQINRLLYQFIFKKYIARNNWLTHEIGFIAALMDDGHGYFLNGNWIIDWPGRYQASGTSFNYQRTKDSESIASRGPLQKDVIVMVNNLSGGR